MKMLRIIPVALIFLGAVLIFELPAHAYADPGTGLLAVQAAGSALVATGWYLRRRIYTLLHRADVDKPQQEEMGPVARRQDSPNQ